MPLLTVCTKERSCLRSPGPAGCRAGRAPVKVLLLVANAPSWRRSPRCRRRSRHRRSGDFHQVPSHVRGTEPVGGLELGEVLDHIGRAVRRSVRHHFRRRLMPGDGFRRDPGQRYDARVDAHDFLPALRRVCLPARRRPAVRRNLRILIRDRQGRAPASREGCQHHPVVGAPSLVGGRISGSNRSVTTPRITVFLADDSLIVREGVRALIAGNLHLEVVGVAEDFDEAVDGATASCRRCWSPTSGCRRPSSVRASTRPRRCASAIRGPGSWCCRSTRTPSTPSRCSPRAAGYGYLLKDPRGRG